jgi:putative CocE/NonD family hydrolase
MGPADQRPEEGRNDVLVYTGAPLEHDLTLIGEARLTIVVASDAPSADVIARLVDVYPDGASVNVADGNRRISLADGPCTVELTLSATAITFLAGHRIRLDVTGSSFPLFDRNPHSEEPATTATADGFRFARHLVFHDAERRSLIELPIAPASTKDDP